MKKFSEPGLVVILVIVSGLFVFNSSVSGQDTVMVSVPLPDSINSIVTRSCMPCHSNDGGLMSRTKLNFSAWTNYPADKQGEKARKIYSELSEAKMPPKKARENKPELIPTGSQIETIRKWSETFKVPDKQE